MQITTTTINIAKYSNAGWATVRVILKEILTDSLNNDNYPIRALCLNESLQFPNELKCESINVLILEFFYRSSPSLSFLLKFSNLKVFKLITASIDEDMVSIISELSF
jgi:hypothetical protein